MSRLQPVGQKRLTNICVVRLKRNGKRFEVACYKNTVIAWRNKVEKDVDEVLQAHTIYMNVEKGILAKSEDLTQAFGTDDEDVICLEILNKGEFQVSERERQMQMDSLFKDIASRVTDMCINPETQKPYPLSTIERALREELHFAPQANKPVKAQAMTAFRQLKASTVLPVARAQMLLRLCCPSASKTAVLQALRQLATDTTDVPGFDQLELLEAEAHTDALDSSAAVEAVGTDSDATVDGGEGGAASVRCLADPSLYRGISDLMAANGGTVQVIELKATFERSVEKVAAGDFMSAHGAVSAQSGPAPAVANSVRVGGAASSTEPKPDARSMRAQAPKDGAAARRAERMFKLNLRNAENGDPVAQLEVGKAYCDGCGVDLDLEAGKEWLRQAAQQGVNAAQSKLDALSLAE